MSLHRIAFHLNCLEHGGAERVVSTLANRFAADGYEVLVATEWTGAVEYPLDPRVKRVTVGPRPEDEKKSRLSKAMLRIRYLREFLLQEKPDVLVAFMHGANFRALRACRGTGIPVVISIRNNPSVDYGSRVDHFLIRHLFPRAAGCVYQTQDQKAYFAPYLQDNSAVIANPINQKYIDLPDMDYAACDKAVVQSSRLVGFKNQDMLLRAFFLVHERHPDWILRLYGQDGGDGTREKLLQLVEAHGAQEYIRFLGDCSDLEVELRHNAIFTLSSDYEGMPNALLEAMALGLPCIATDCPPGGPREMIRSGENGLLVPVGDTKAMADAICALIEDPQRREQLGRSARKIRDVAGVDAIYQQWKDYLHRTLEGWKQA